MYHVSSSAPLMRVIDALLLPCEQPVSKHTRHLADTRDTCRRTKFSGARAGQGQWAGFYVAAPRHQCPLGARPALTLKPLANHNCSGFVRAMSLHVGGVLRSETKQAVAAAAAAAEDAGCHRILLVRALQVDCSVHKH